MTARFGENIQSGLALALLAASAIPPYQTVVLEKAGLFAFGAVLLDRLSYRAGHNQVGSGALALTLCQGLPAVGGVWLMASVAVIRWILALLTRGAGFAFLAPLWPAVLVALAAKQFSLPLGLWLLLYVALNGPRYREALVEGAWAGFLLGLLSDDVWSSFLGVLALLLSFRGQPEEPNELEGEFHRQMERAEATLRSSHLRHQKERGKYQDFVALQALLDDFQGQALKTGEVAPGLLHSAAGLDPGATGAVISLAAKPLQVLAATEGFQLEEFGAVPSQRVVGKLLRSPDELRLVFPLDEDYLFLWLREAARKDVLRDELMRHLLERAGLIWRIQSQQTELAETLGQKSRALEELANSQQQLVQSGKLAAVGQLAAGVAHEINSPLAAIVLQAQVARRRLEKDDKEGVLRSLEIFDSAGQRAKVIIDNLLNFSRLSDGRRVAFPLLEAVKQARALVEGRLAPLAVDCRIEVSPDLQVVANLQEVDQILTNVMLNAADALRERAEERKLELRARRLGDTVELEIANNGPLIPEEHLEKLFEPFFTTKPAGQGTGLGLSLGYQMARSQGGSLVAENRHNEVVFRLTLPAGL